MSRFFALLAAFLNTAIASLPIEAYAATLSLVGSNTKVCQLIGGTDWTSHLPTAAKTATNFGLDAVDLGFPVDSGAGPLFFLFGDALPNGHSLNSIPSAPPDDALGFTTRTAVPTASTCLDLQVATSAPKTFAHPTVQPPIQQGSFNVPTGGVFFDNTFYAFFWTDHCVIPTALTPDPTSPLDRPPPSATCPEIPESSSVGRSVLAAAAPANPVAFHWTIPPGGLLFPEHAKRVRLCERGDAAATTVRNSSVRRATIPRQHSLSGGRAPRDLCRRGYVGILRRPRSGTSRLGHAPAMGKRAQRSR
jgi:hypothetical protein